MPNEVLFFSHLFVICAISIVAARVSKTALMLWIAVQALLSNLFVLKQISLFYLTVTPSDGFIIGSLISLNLLQEYWDKKSAQKSTYLSFALLSIFCLLSTIHLLYTPAECDQMHGAYSQLLKVAPRLFIASITAFFISQRCDIFLFQSLKKRWKNASISKRMIVSGLISQFIDTGLFTYLGLWQRVEHPLHVFALSFVIKAISIISMSALLKFCTPLLPKRDHVSI